MRRCRSVELFKSSQMHTDCTHIHVYTRTYMHMELFMAVSFALGDHNNTCSTHPFLRFLSLLIALSGPGRATLHGGLGSGTGVRSPSASPLLLFLLFRLLWLAALIILISSFTLYQWNSGNLQYSPTHLIWYSIPTVNHISHTI